MKKEKYIIGSGGMFEEAHPNPGFFRFNLEIAILLKIQNFSGAF
jgi:hypothetical protein